MRPAISNSFGCLDTCVCVWVSAFVELSFINDVTTHFMNRMWRSIGMEPESALTHTSLMRNYKVKAPYSVGIAHINYSLVSSMDTLCTFCAQ